MSDLKKHIQLMEARGVLGADNGELDLYIGNETIKLGKTPEEVASKLKTIKDLDLDDLYASSSVDFADEYGFANEDDAHELFDKAVALMIPKPDENRAKVEDEPITSELLAKLNAEESIEEAVGEYTYTLEYNGEAPSGYTVHKLTITSPEGESKVVADDFTYFEPEEQDMQAELKSWFEKGHGVGDEQDESIELRKLAGLPLKEEESLEDKLKSTVEGYKRSINDYHEAVAELENRPRISKC